MATLWQHFRRNALLPDETKCSPLKPRHQVAHGFHVIWRNGLKPDETAPLPSVNRLVAGSNPARGAKFYKGLAGNG